MPAHKSGFHPNPQVARALDRGSAAKPAAKAQSGPPDMQGSDQPVEPAHMVEIHHPDSPTHPAPGSGSFHTTTHHADGNEEHADHASAGEAADHAKMQLGDDGMDEIDDTDEVDVKAADDGAY